MSPLEAAGWFLFLLLVGVPWLNGMIDHYMAYRLARKATGILDRTALFLNWQMWKWTASSQPENMAEKHPWMQNDLTETLEESEQDEVIT